MRYDTTWHGFCLHILWHASLFNWTRLIVCLEQIEILIMRASWHGATVSMKISFVFRAKIACPCHHHYAWNPVEGHIYISRNRQPKLLKCQERWVSFTFLISKRRGTKTSSCVLLLTSLGSTISWSHLCFHGGNVTTTEASHCSITFATAHTPSWSTASMFSPTVKFIAIGVIELSVKKDETDAEQSDQSTGNVMCNHLYLTLFCNLYNRENHVFVFEI